MSDSIIDDGGFAFPLAGSTAEWNDVKKQWTPQSGMSLRDWFAGMAMAEVYAARLGLDYTDEETIGQAVARNAYRLADDMIAARKEGAK